MGPFEVHGVPGADDDVEARPGDHLVHRLGDSDELGVVGSGDDLHRPVELAEAVPQRPLGAGAGEAQARGQAVDGVGLAVGWPIVALAIRLADCLKQRI